MSDVYRLLRFVLPGLVFVLETYIYLLLTNFSATNEIIVSNKMGLGSAGILLLAATGIGFF
ncbi:hypothetical protein LCGC14_2907580, partial [marine sediment metagenome]